MAAKMANRQRRAAEVRAVGTRPGLEPPRDVYLTACAAIGGHLVERHGFRYAKSGPRARRQSGEFAFEVNFQSDRNNVAGERVGLWIHGIVLSARLKAWSSTQALLHSFDRVAGGQIGNLQADHCWMDWELADRERRDATIGDATRAVEELALPYFARFEDLTSLIALLVQEDLPAMGLYQRIAFLMCFADNRTAQLAAAKFLRQHPDVVSAYREEFARYAHSGPHWEFTTTPAETLASLSHAFKFGDLTNSDTLTVA